MGDDRFVTVRIRKPLLIRIKRLVKLKEDLGYGTPSGFVNDAIRRRLEDIENKG
jgi:hypothetical protein